jgi:predicted O-methyltransferase YrrM
MSQPDTIAPIFTAVDDYIERNFTRPDEALLAALRESEAAGLPKINVSANEGKILAMLARISGAKRVLEIGLLGGFSTIFLARALPSSGQVISLELSAKNAEVARKNLERAGVADRVEIRVGPALESLAAMRVVGEEPFDFVFIDADKCNYPRYFDEVMHLVRPGSLIVGDNVIRAGHILDDAAGDADLLGLQEFNRLMAHDPRLDSIAIPLIRWRLDGIAVGLVL